MTREDLVELHKTMTEKALGILRTKNHDYSGGSDGSCPFLNFSRVQNMGITDTKTGFLVRMTDKLSRLVTFVKNGTFQTKDEALEDTVIDLINYSILLYGYAQTEKDDYKEIKNGTTVPCSP